MSIGLIMDSTDHRFGQTGQSWPGFGSMHTNGQSQDEYAQLATTWK